MQTQPPAKILILCTGNSARSVLGEYLLRAKGKGRFEVFSAGSHPTGRVNPLAQRVLQERYGLDASAARSKSWDEFKDVKFDFVITVCDHAREACPIWPGQPVVAHWGSPDPAAFEGTEEEKYRGFVNVASQIARRADLFCAFSEEKLRDLVAVRGVGEQFKLDGETAMKR
jgi:protein-tyrosine-phosphatase